MSLDWRSYCRGGEFSIEGNVIEVALADARRHKIKVREDEACFHLHAIVAKPRVIASLTDLKLTLWMRNRSLSLIGFRVDPKGRLVGEAWVPKDGLSRKEFCFYLHTLAAESDRLEQQLSGADFE